MGRKMKHKLFLTALILGLGLSLMACGVPKEEHEKVVKELQQANQDKTTLTEQMDQMKKEKDSLSQKVASLEAEIGKLKKENEELKAKLAPKKPAPKKAPAKKK
jgi:peptidoglycan hydrolase CwlO-like protein